MNEALLFLVGYALWALLLATVLVTCRLVLVLQGKKEPNEFPSGVPHGGDAYWRLNRAHLNAVENLPIAATIVLAGILAQATDALFVRMTGVVLAARVAQSVAHLVSGSANVVRVRFAFYLLQVACLFVLAALVVLSLSRT